MFEVKPSLESLEEPLTHALNSKAEPVRPRSILGRWGLNLPKSLTPKRHLNSQKASWEGQMELEDGSAKIMACSARLGACSAYAKFRVSLANISRIFGKNSEEEFVLQKTFHL